MSYILIAILCFTGAAAVGWYAHCLSLEAKVDEDKDNKVNN